MLEPGPVMSLLFPSLRQAAREVIRSGRPDQSSAAGRIMIRNAKLQVLAGGKGSGLCLSLAPMGTKAWRGIL